MSALYQMQYHGVAGVGHGAIYIGKGKIVGIDITGATYRGSYAEQGSSLSGSVTLTSAGATLVTGQAVPAGTQISIALNLPSNFADGQPKQVSVGGRPVQVSFRKIDDIP